MYDQEFDYVSVDIQAAQLLRLVTELITSSRQDSLQSTLVVLSSQNSDLIMNSTFIFYDRPVYMNLDSTA
jgi:hypothetical protein